MARPQLRSAKQPLPVRFLLRLYEVLASLRLAVVLISASVIVLAWATVVEGKYYGTEAVHFGIYGSWWFAGMMGLLGLNVLCAALIRFPWKKHQTGFLITHAGILVLLVGCLVSSLGGTEALLWVFEGGTGRLAFKETQHFELTIDRQASDDAGRRDTKGGPAADAQQRDPTQETIEVPFVPGPFNWDRYRDLAWFPWRLSRRDRGVLYDQDGIKLEVLDYYSDSDIRRGPPLELRVKSGSSEWSSVRLQVRGVEDLHSAHATMGMASRQGVPGDAWIVLLLAESRAETDAFRNSRPEGPLGARGQVVLYAGGRSHRFSVEQLQQRKRVPLGDTGLTVEFVGFEPTLLRVELLIHHWDATRHRMVLYADVPEFNRQDREYGVFGSYWFDTAKAADASQLENTNLPDLRKLRRPRIDVLQGADQKLYYRTWKSPELATIAALPVDGTRVVAFDESDAPVAFYVERFVPHDRPGWRIKPGRFDKDKSAHARVRQARIRLTVDGNAEQFWLEGMAALPVESPPRAAERQVVLGNRRRVAVTLPWDRLDLGFQLYLHRFQRKLDPGTSMASHYSSLVDVLDPEDEQKRLQENVLITLNEPATFADPKSGRSYRVYQATFNGPYRPGHPYFDERVGGSGSREELFISGLTINYDPGRGLKYFGCLLIVVGIATMFYMRAYFFGRRPSRIEIG